MQRLQVLTLSALLLLSLLSVQPVYAERIGGSVEQLYRIEGSDEIEGSLRIHQLIGIEFSDTDFIKGMEIHLEVPQSAMEFRESFLFRIFSSLNREPDTAIKYYSGRESFRKPFPTGKSLYIAIPLKGDELWEPGGVGIAAVKPPIARADFPLLFTIEPVMKGIPSSVSNADFDFTITPVLYDRGNLSIDIRGSYDVSALSLSIDGTAHELEVRNGDDTRIENRVIALKTGMHELKVESPSTLPYSTTFGIEQGETTRLEVNLEPARSYVSFEAPEEATIYFDGNKLPEQDLESVETEPGEHIVLVQLGEYSLSKKIRLDRGQNYKVSLFFDILVDER